MPDPIAFPSSTPTIGLPLLIAGQAQKEFFVNQAMFVLDALYMRAVAASQPEPPADAADASCYRVTAPATGVWSGRADQIAVLIGGDWHFVMPTEGMQLFDRTAGHMLVFRSQWQLATAPALPSGGNLIDAEARAAIAALTQALVAIGLLGATAS